MREFRERPIATCAASLGILISLSVIARAVSRPAISFTLHLVYGAGILLLFLWIRRRVTKDVASKLGSFFVTWSGLEAVAAMSVWFGLLTHNLYAVGLSHVKAADPEVFRKDLIGVPLLWMLNGIVFGGVAWAVGLISCYDMGLVAMLRGNTRSTQETTMEAQPQVVRKSRKSHKNTRQKAGRRGTGASEGASE